MFHGRHVSIDMNVIRRFLETIGMIQRIVILIEWCRRKGTSTKHSSATTSGGTGTSPYGGDGETTQYSNRHYSNLYRSLSLSLASFLIEEGVGIENGGLCLLTMTVAVCVVAVLVVVGL